MSEADPLDLDEYVNRAAKNYRAKLVRDWALDVLCPPAIRRMYEMGMGITKFDVPTMVGSIVSVPAPAAVQRAALHDVIQVGLPGQLGLVDAEGNQLPGVIALGAYDMHAAQAQIHGTRFEAIGAAVQAELHANDQIADVPPPKATGGYEVPKDHELVVVEEDGTAATRNDDTPPPAERDDDTPTPEQIALAKHRDRMARAKHKPVPAAPTSSSAYRD